MYEEYKKAPDVTRERIYLETMERVLGGSDKLIYDGGPSGQGVVPYLPLSELSTKRPHDHRPAVERRHADEVSGYRHRRAARGASVVVIVGYMSLFTVQQTEQTIVLQFGAPVDVVTDPGLHFKAPWNSVINVDKRILDLENPSQEVIASDQKRLVVDAFARYRIKDALRFYQSVGSIQAANLQLTSLLNAALRRVLGEVTFITVVRDEREKLMGRIREQLDREAGGYGIEVVDVRIRRADLPEQNSQAVYDRMKSERAARGGRIPRAGRPEGAGNLARRPTAMSTVIIAEANSTGRADARRR